MLSSGVWFGTRGRSRNGDAEEPFAQVAIGVVAERALGEVEHRVANLGAQDGGVAAAQPRLQRADLELRRHRQAAERALIAGDDAPRFGVEDVGVAALARDVLEARRAASAGRRQERHRLADLLLDLGARATEIFAQVMRRQLGHNAAVVVAVRLDRHTAQDYLAALSAAV